jgi:hypothetical protein
MAGGGMIVVCDGSVGLLHVAARSAQAASPAVAAGKRRRNDIWGAIRALRELPSSMR